MRLRKKKITQKQKDYILSLLSKLQPEKAVELSKKWQIENLDNFSRLKASLLIEELKKEVKKKWDTKQS